MWLRLAVYADVAELSSHQGIYRRHESSMSKAAYANAGLDDLQACLRAFDEVLTSHQAAIPDAERLRALAHRACARRMVGRASTLYERGVRRPDHVEELLRIAVDADPSAQRSLVYLKFRLRRLVGVTAASTLGRVRSRHVAVPQQQVPGPKARDEGVRQ
jgi:hypothetical protein